jgi:hypothetical protein
MARYLVRPRAGAWIKGDHYDYDEPLRLSLTVDDAKETDTGLVTLTGEPIYRLQAPIGFGRDEEW